MKFIIISILLLAILAGVCCFSACRVTEAIEDTSKLLEAAVDMQQHNNREATVNLIRAASRQWRSHEVFFGTVLRHDEIDNVISEFARLESYAQTNDEDDFLSNCAALIAQLRHIREMEWPYLQNIL